MDLKDLQEHVGRLEASPDKAYERIADSSSLMPVRLLGATTEIAADVGVLANLVFKWLYRGQSLDMPKLKGSIAGLFMSVAGLCNAAGLNMEELIHLEKKEVVQPEVDKSRYKPLRWGVHWLWSCKLGFTHGAEGHYVDPALFKYLRGDKVTSCTESRYYSEELALEDLRQALTRQASEPTGPSPLAKVAQSLDIQIEMEKAQDKRRREQLPASHKDKYRTKSQVLAAKKTVQGCCNRHADMQGCDCLDKALPDHCGQMSNGLDCNVCGRRLLGRLMSEVCPYRQEEKSEHANYLKEF